MADNKTLNNNTQWVTNAQGTQTPQGGNINPASTVTSPTWEVSTPGWTILNWAPASKGTPDSTGNTEVTPTAQEAASNAIKSQNDALKATQKRADNLTAETVAKIKQDTATKNGDIARTKNFADAKKKQINSTDTQIAAEQAKVNTIANDRKNRDVAVLKAQADAEKEANKQAIALQHSKDNEAIAIAKQQTELDQQKSAWAFQKLWLWFSSWIILQSQQIATNWAHKIATLKTQANYNQAQIKLEASKIQVSYTKQTNAIIDKYTDVQLANKQDIINRIDKTNNNLLMTEQDKQNNISKIEKEYRANTRATADKMHSEQERLADRANQQATDLENKLKAKQNEGRAELDNQLASWDIMRMTPAEISAKEVELWMQPWTISAKVGLAVSKAIRWQFDKFIWKDYMPLNMPTLVSDVQEWMKTWQTFDEAINTVMANELKGNAKYKKIQEASNAKLSDTIARANWTWRYAPKSTWGSGSSKSTLTAGDLIWKKWTEWTIFKDRQSYNQAYSNLLNAWYKRTDLQAYEKAWKFDLLNNLALQAWTTLRDKALVDWTASAKTVQDKFKAPLSALSEVIWTSQEFKKTVNNKNQTIMWKSSIWPSIWEKLFDMANTDYYKNDIIAKTKDLINWMDNANIPKDKQKNYMEAMIKNLNLDKKDTWIYIDWNSLYINEYWFDSKILDFNK